MTDRNKGVEAQLAHSGTGVDGFDDLLTRYGRSEFKSPYRSTVPLLSYWREVGHSAMEVGKGLGFVLEAPLVLHFEFEVPVQRGSGYPSCTDLMLRSGETSVAIEAKRTEPRYETVKRWLPPEEDSNRHQVLKGWLELLRAEDGSGPWIGDVQDLPYQLVHRAASACYPDTRNHWLLYQVFGVSDRSLESYRRDLGTLRRLLPAGLGLRIRVLRCAIEPSNRQRELERRWDAGERDLRDSVLSLLREDDTFEFGEAEVIAV